MKKKLNYNFNFSNKTILITGGLGNLGFELTKSFLDLGAEVIIIDYNISPLKKKLFKHNEKIRFFECDLSINKKRKKLINDIKERTETIDCLINNATYLDKNFIAPLKSQSVESFKDSFDVSLVAPFHLSKELSKLMKGSKDPNIINISSIYSIVAPDFKLYKDTKMGNAAAYTVAKSGLNQLTLWFASMLSPKIRVNSISPGGIIRDQPKKFIDKYKKKTLLNRMAKEKDIVGPTLFLASNLAQYITGHNLVVDGGYTKT